MFSALILTCGMLVWDTFIIMISKILSFEHTKHHHDKNCRQCKITKLKRKPFYSSPNNASKPMELVHSDVIGKLETSYNDFNYCVTFLDDFSRKIWVYLIKNKSDVPNIFIKFHKFISNTTSYKIINFKSDNGTEYINKTLTTYLENFGINNKNNILIVIPKTMLSDYLFFFF